MWGRWSICILALFLPLAGCAAGGRSLIKPDTLGSRPGQLRVREASPALADLTARVNSNAKAVQSLTASTTVSASGSRFGTGVSGMMALERPRNFKMELNRGLAATTVVDVGSNDDEFWFWMRDSEKKAIYVGAYDEQGETASEFLFHPDWIIEALGLRAIGTSEIAAAQLTRGREPNTLVLTQSRPDARGGTRIKRTYFDESTRQVTRHVFYGSDNKTPVAEVFPSNFRRYSVASANAEGATVELPQRIQLRLTPPTRDPKDQVVMDIALRDLHINPTNLDRQALFSVPSYSGYEVVELAPRRGDEAPPSAAARADRDAPSRRASHDVLLQEPVPMNGNEGAWLHRREPAPLGADLAQGRNAPIGVESIVRPTLPEPPVVR